MRTGCYICSKKIDKFYIMATPDGKKFKLCGRCMVMAKSIAKNAESEEVENVEEEQ